MRRVVGERTQRERRDSDEVGARRCTEGAARTHGHADGARVCGVRSGTVIL